MKRSKKQSKKHNKKIKSLALPAPPINLFVYRFSFDYDFDLQIPAGNMWYVSLLTREPMDVGIVTLKKKKAVVTTDKGKYTSETASKQKVVIVDEDDKGKEFALSYEGVTGLKATLYVDTGENGSTIVPKNYSRISLNYLSHSQNPDEVQKKGLLLINQFLKAYRAASGDPVPPINEGKKFIGYRVFEVAINSRGPGKGVSITKLSDAMEALKREYEWHEFHSIVGYDSPSFDTMEKPLSLAISKKTIQYAMRPETIRPYTDIIVDAIERVHYEGDYEMGIVRLNTAFELAITFNLMSGLMLLGKNEVEVNQFLDENSSLEDKRKAIDAVKSNVENQFRFPNSKKFRGSGAESQWNKTTYQHRHSILHVVREGKSEFKKEDFELALKWTQEAIKLVELPIEKIMEIRRNANKEV